MAYRRNNVECRLSEQELEDLANGVRAGTVDPLKRHFADAEAWANHQRARHELLEAVLAGTHDLRVGRKGISTFLRTVPRDVTRIENAGEMESGPDGLTVAECEHLCHAINGGTGFTRAEAIKVLDWAGSIRRGVALLDSVLSGQIVINVRERPFRFYAAKASPVRRVGHPSSASPTSTIIVQ